MTAIPATGEESRRLIRSGGWRQSTGSLAPGYEQANMVILPSEHALDFARFCIRNPAPCPVLDILEPGNSRPAPHVAGDADVRTDLPRYRIYRHGVVAEEVTDIQAVWNETLVTFLLGCSYGFDLALQKAGIPVRHVELGTNNPMYITNRACVPAGPFRGNLVVSMRPVHRNRVPEVIDITSRYPEAHGGPVHTGDPALLGIADLERVDFGEAVPVYDGEVPVFWACGVTPQAVLMQAKLPFAITHAPGHMFVLDRKLRAAI